MRRMRNVIAALGVFTGIFITSETLFGWPWSADMFRQPSVRPQASAPLNPPEGTLPVDGEPPMDRFEAAKVLKNPAPATRDSLASGKVHYENYCVVCHGPKGHGDGPVASKFATPANLTLPMYVKMPDGLIYGIIRNGGANMPRQGDALYPNDRWDIVNYVRSLQKQ